MFRTLIIIAALALVYLIIKNRLQSKKASKPNLSSTHSEDTVKCLECKTYVPRTEAIGADEEQFCCKQHQRDWQAKNK